MLARPAQLHGGSKRGDAPNDNRNRVKFKEPRCHPTLSVCRYAVAMSLPTCCKEGVYYDLDYPPYSVRVTDEGGDSLQVVVSGEEHDQGIPADEYADYHARYSQFK